MCKSIQLTWLGHSCFRMEAGGYVIVLDPFQPGSVPGLKPVAETAHEVLCSHGHHDHGYTEAVTLEKTTIPSPFTVTKVDCFHDDEGGAKRGENIIYIFEVNGIRIAHFGDIGHLLAPEQLQAIGKLDAALIPVGGYYTIDAETAKCLIDQLKPTVVIPMHYRTADFGFAEIALLDDFLALCSNVKHYPTDTISISKDMEEQTAVLQYQK